MPVRVRPPAPGFALTGYAWRSHAKAVRPKRVRRSLKRSESEDGLVRGSDGVAANQSFRNAPAGNAEQHDLRRCHDAAGLRPAEGPAVSRTRRVGPTSFDVYAQPVIALAISFVVAGLFWFSHHRRLAEAPEASRGVVFLNLLFLLSIIILPVTNGLYGSYRLDGVVAVIYGGHLAVIATLNGLLWILALRGPPRSAIAGDGVIPDPRIS